MSADETCFFTATEQKTLLASRRISALELLELHLDRVKRVNPSCNAVVALDEEGARRQAHIADEKLVRSETTGPLHGLPMTIKDSFAVAGMAATCGLEELRDYRPREDAVTVAKIRAGGAVIFGKTNLPAGAADHQSRNTLFGLTRNPWDGERTVGGSSGGSAAALAAGLTSLELGSDIGGSIRVPAHFCGVYGHKPSYGLVSTEGHIPPPPGHIAPAELGVAGPLARSAFDLELLLDVVLGASDVEAAGAQLRLPAPRHDDLRSFRVAVWNDAQAYPLDDGYAAAIDGLVDDLVRIGVTVDRAARPAIDPAASYDVYLQTLFGIIGAGLPPPAREALLAAGEVAESGSYPRRVADAVRQTLPQFFAGTEQRHQLYRAWRRFFADYDVLLCPVTPTVAFPHDIERLDLAAQFTRRLAVNGRTVPYMDNLAWPGLVTVANLPATAVPTGRMVGSVPAGVQIVGPYLGDRTTLRFAQLVEQALGGFTRAPRI
ncbi:amidase [Bradyrhizobium manausense]|uniref:amidase n=1 Tax=Bradyrhizobium TaxID=374 RepID=UPI001BA75EF3|nr:MULTISPECIES: amidase [Bradyrhizobium]MBR0829951.1 amidase [Bradyrhizobium manausense]UVO27691.1 amidase [Bradyrhizobium arachidis]